MATEKVIYEITLRDKFSKSLSGADRKAKKFESGLGRIGRLIPAVFAVGAVGMFGKAVLDTSLKIGELNRSIIFSSGSASEAKKNMDFLRQTVDSLGLDLESSTSGFKTFTASTIGTSIQGEKARKVFLAVSKASSVMGLSAEQSKGTFIALGQMISKGKVSAEELRQQLAERLPGSVNIAARALGVTTGELDKMLKKGEVLADDFLPKFATELEKTFGAGAKGASNSLRANLNRINNSFTDLKIAIGTKVLPVLNEFLKTVLTNLPKMGEAWEQFKTSGMGVIQPLIDIKNEFADLFGIVDSGLTFWEELTLKIRLAFIPFRALTAVVKTIIMPFKALFSLFSDSDSSTKKMGASFESLTQKLDNWEMSIDLLPKTVSNSLSAVGTFFSEFFKEVGQGLLNMGNLIKETFDIEKVIKSGGANIESAFNKVKNFDSFGKAKSRASEAFQKDQADARIAFRAKKNAGVRGQNQNLLLGGVGGAAGMFGKAFASGKNAPGGGAAGSEVNIKDLSGGVSGQRPSVVNINIEKLVEQLTVMSETIEGGAVKVKEEMTKALLTAINDINVISANG